MGHIVDDLNDHFTLMRQPPAATMQFSPFVRHICGEPVAAAGLAQALVLF